jgi:hypothetical protein
MPAMVHCRSQLGVSVLAVAALVLPAGLAAQDKAADEVLAAIAAQFEKTPSELSRYEKISFYGETLSSGRPGKETLAAQVALLGRAKAAGLLGTLPPPVQQLGHNVVVFAPESAAEYVRALHDAANAGNEKIRGALYFATMAAGEAGERAVVAELAADKVENRRFWASLLGKRGIYASSVEPIKKRIGSESDSEVKTALVFALAAIGAPSALPLCRDLLEHSKDDAVQAAAIWACVEIGGFADKATVQGAKPVGPKAEQEQRQGLDYLTKETGEKSKHGREVSSDSEFVARFADLQRCPIIRWLGEQHLLEEEAVKTPTKLSAEQKAKLLELLVDSKGFGLEAVKGALFLSLAKTDEAMLLKIRAANFITPNGLIEGRLKTLDLMLRHLRQDL